MPGKLGPHRAPQAFTRSRPESNATALKRPSATAVCVQSRTDVRNVCGLPGSLASLCAVACPLAVCAAYAFEHTDSLTGKEKRPDRSRAVMPAGLRQRREAR